uniref:Uncharacterized protein n=1 Tax=Glossina pallidipes TaxID=7398 RepID=A0A1B0A1G6_GLOPL
MTHYNGHISGFGRTTQCRSLKNKTHKIKKKIKNILIMCEDTGPVVIDNGGYTPKLGLSCHDDTQIMPNYIVKAKAERPRAFIGSQIDECRGASAAFSSLSSSSSSSPSTSFTMSQSSSSSSSSSFLSTLPLALTPLTALITAFSDLVFLGYKV